MVSIALELLNSTVSFIAGNEPDRLEGASGLTTTGTTPANKHTRINHKTRSIKTNITGIT